MADSFFGETAYPIRSDLDEATRGAWALLGKPGNWWTGGERASLVAEVRAARDCRFCAERVAALSPHSVSGEHETASTLPAVAIEAAHRLTTDAARLDEKAIRKFNEAGLSDEAYVEIVSVVSTVMGIDSFCDALELPLLPLPEVQAGEPSHYRPAEAVNDVGWVPMIPNGGAGKSEADLYRGPFAPNVLRAMSVVPDAVRNLMALLGTFYVKDIIDLKARNSLDRLQIELLAARVSALNECFY